MRAWQRLKRLNTEDVVVLMLAFLGVVFGFNTLEDNSTLLHLRTGDYIFDTWSVPDVDPYSFTAAGRDWLVQSWLADGIYGALHSLGTYNYIIILNGVITVAVATITALLARTGNTGRTALAGFAALAVGIPLWTPRPFLFALLGFALLILIVHKQKSVLWLFPIVYIWANTHGSWPIGFGWLILALIGQRLDRDRVRIAKYALVFLAALIPAALNPVGPKILTFFTVAVGENRDAFEGITEWASPDFHSISGVIILVGLMLSVLVLAKGRPSWRYLLPALALFAASLWSIRYCAFLSIALAPALRSALVPSAEHAAAQASSLITRVSAVAVVLAAALPVIETLRGPEFDFDVYPVQALQAVEGAERVLTQEWVGDYQVFVDGSEANVFMDDRYDMYPAEVVTDYRDFEGSRGRSQELLAKYNFDAVVWQTDSTLGDYLRETGNWQVAFSDEDWTAFKRIER